MLILKNAKRILAIMISELNYLNAGRSVWVTKLKSLQVHVNALWLTVRLMWTSSIE